MLDGALPEYHLYLQKVLYDEVSPKNAKQTQAMHHHFKPLPPMKQRSRKSSFDELQSRKEDVVVKANEALAKNANHRKPDISVDEHDKKKRVLEPQQQFMKARNFGEERMARAYLSHKCAELKHIHERNEKRKKEIEQLNEQCNLSGAITSGQQSYISHHSLPKLTQSKSRPVSPTFKSTANLFATHHTRRRSKSVNCNRPESSLDSFLFEVEI